MNLKEYQQLKGGEAMDALAEKIGTSRAYLSHCANGHRRPSVDMAHKLVEASNHELDFVSLLLVPQRKPGKRSRHNAR